MDSSKKRWTNVFKNDNIQSSQHGINSSGGDDEEKPVKPKFRWYPTKEQFRILESIFNSGMTNPSSGEIKRICAQLQEFGPIGESNVFYWFQNHKSRIKAKHKQRLPYNRRSPKIIKKSAVSSSSSSSYDHQNAPPNELMAPPNNEFFAMNQNQVGAFYTPTQTDFQLPTTTPPFFSDQLLNMIQPAVPQQENDILPLNQNQVPTQTDLLQLPRAPFFSNELLNVIQPAVPQQIVDVPDLLNHEDFMNYWNGIQMNVQHDQGNNQDQVASMNMLQQEEQPQMNFGVSSNLSNHDSTDLAPLPPITIDAPVVNPFPNTQFQDGVVLADSFFQPVPIDEWGVTLQPLQNGASYFLVLVQ
ncbi:hypothetical protein TSUD_17920 [Trifolium subterraneum]|uniref:Homeobox domain-containing protein n=1 Tax=Trifolium subterraneum TaxID=3900 RepID=A0A2Z6N1H1_TRISU|nr:hypothetical protein TSUD_17920 [Trifolium subterraneum]